MCRHPGCECVAVYVRLTCSQTGKKKSPEEAAAFFEKAQQCDANFIRTYTEWACWLQVVCTRLLWIVIVWDCLCFSCCAFECVVDCCVRASDVAMQLELEPSFRKVTI